MGVRLVWTTRSCWSRLHTGYGPCPDECGRSRRLSLACQLFISSLWARISWDRHDIRRDRGLRRNGHRLRGRIHGQRRAVWIYFALGYEQIAAGLYSSGGLAVGSLGRLYGTCPG